MVLLFIGLVVLVRHAMRDINLDVDLLRESLMKMPGLVMENIQMSREYLGDMWRVKIPLMEQEGTALKMRSLDIRRELSGDKGEWYFFGYEGVYSYDEKAAAVNRLLGTLDDGSGRVWNLESSRLNWRESSDALIFPQGLTIYDSEFILQTPHASIDKSGVILLQQGGVIKWTRPLEQ